MEEVGSLHFKPIESSEIPFEDLLFFLNTHYTSRSDAVQVTYDLDYLRWFFSEGGVLGLSTINEEWVAIFCVGAFLLRHGNCQPSVFNSGPLCVSKSYLFKNHAQKVVEETSNYVKNKYKIPILGAGVTGVKKDTMLKRFGMYLGENIQKPSSSYFSSNNLFLCDESSFLKRFENKQGFLFHYTQNVKYKNKNEKWGIIVSYHTTGCWKQMVYDFGVSHLGSYDRVLIFENLERKGEELEDIGFKKFTSYNLYVDSPINLPEYFLYYNLFLY
tara:strand:- start:605 stop:1420 length:816 start_codon:yes stop_codon:yes gene_type:complete